MKDTLTVELLNKNYKDFCLKNISFQIPQGAIVGLIGENGAGKSTTINSILGLVKKDSGNVTILGNKEEKIDVATRERIGVVLDGSNFSEELTPLRLNKVLRDIYHSWDETFYFSLLEKIADYIVFIHDGKIIFSKTKDDLLDNYGIIKCGAEAFEAIDQEDIISYRKMDYEWQILTDNKKRVLKKYPKAMILSATIDEIMLLLGNCETSSQS